MSVVQCKKTRRQFLVGSGKMLLTLPALPSLFSSEAVAQVASVSPRIMFLHFGHNCLKTAWPARTVATTPVGSSGAMEALMSSFASSSAISPILSNAVYENLRKKNQITIARGIDNYFFGNGHGAQALSGVANYRVDQYYPGPFPSIDTVMEASSALYPASTPASTVRAMRVNDFEYTISYKRSGTNGVQGLSGFSSLTDMYTQVFSSLTGGTVPAVDPTLTMKNNIINRVYNSYTSLKSNRKISSEDKLRVDEHLAFLTDVQKRFVAGTSGGTQSSCAKPASPGNSSGYLEYIPLYLDLMAVAFKCGLSKIGTMSFEGHIGSGVPGITPSGATLHNDIFHNVSGAGTAANTQASYIAWKKWSLDQVANHLLAPLDVLEGSTGRTYLDNMLTVVLTESGVSRDLTGGSGAGFATHDNTDYQPVFFGSMGGAMRAGRYVALPDSGRMPYNMLLITLLELMRIPAAEYSAFNNEKKGFGLYSGGGSFTSRMYSPITELLA